MYREIDYLLDDQRAMLKGAGEVVNLLVWIEIDRLLDARNELGRLLTMEEVGVFEV